jgi:hypothetical protein
MRGPLLRIGPLVTRVAVSALTGDRSGVRDLNYECDARLPSGVVNARAGAEGTRTDLGYGAAGRS